MIALWVVIGFMVVAIIIAFKMIMDIDDKCDAVPVLEEGEHVPVIKKGESNVTIITKDSETILSDEDGNLIPFKKTLD